MRIIIDTNVLVSGIFFGGLPGRLLKMWKDGKIKLVASSEIFHEYAEVIRRLGRKYPALETATIIDLLAVELEMVRTKKISPPICRDPDDDKFIACALSGKVELVISGDQDLLVLKKYKKIRFITPAQFFQELLRA